MKLDGNDTAHDGKQYDRNDNKFDQIQENCTKRFDVGFGEVGIILHQKAGNDRQDQCDKNLHGQ